jgi:hypothetical protein
VASPSDPVKKLNEQLDHGKNLLLTPTLTAVGGAVPLQVGDGATGVDLAGFMIDAGTVSSPALLRIGERHDRVRAAGTSASAAAASTSASASASAAKAKGEPTRVQDVFFRVGGPHAGKARLSLEVNSGNVILDDVWAWRADHGRGVGWTVNPADTGVAVHGDDVTATRLFVEHYQKHDVVWDGERGRTVVFQNELPYDAPNQVAWQHDGVLGYAVYKVGDRVRAHELWGAGSDIYTPGDPSLHAGHGFEVPVTPGVQLHDLLTVELGAGIIDHVVNDTGAPVTSDAVGKPSFVVSFP